MSNPDSPLENRSKQVLPKRGDLYFAVLFLATAVFLLSQLGIQTDWVKGTKLFAQPRFWPAVSLIGMTGFAAMYCLRSIRFSKRDGSAGAEIMLWLMSIEYAFWFLGYVVIVPLLGYLFSTIVFFYALSFRAGYRERLLLMVAGILAVVIVVIFKGLLSVKIPGGLLYEAFPDAVRNFMILYL